MQILFCGHLWNTSKAVAKVMGDGRHNVMLREVREMIAYRETLNDSLEHEIIQVSIYGFIKYDSTPELINVDAILANHEGAENPYC